METPFLHEGTGEIAAIPDIPAQVRQLQYAENLSETQKLAASVQVRKEENAGVAVQACEGKTSGCLTCHAP